VTAASASDRSAVVRSFAIVPAAGRSRRMGQPKLLLQHRGRALIEPVLTAWLASRVERVVVVVHPADEELAAVCAGYDVDVVRPAEPPPEMKDSVLCGLRHVAERYVPRDGDVWLLAPADMPSLSPSAIDRVLAAHEAESPAIVVPAHQGRRGHPVLFPWPLAAEVEGLAADEGINALLARHAVREVDCAAEDLLADIDTPAEFDEWRREANG